MASLVAKKKGNKLYYYVVESARVDGKPRIVHQAYLGTAEKVADLVKDRTAPVPLSATMRDFGLPGSLWLAAQQTGVFSLLESLWPQPRSGPSPAHYLLLAAIHRICQPGPKTEVADWYDRTVLHSLWKIPPERFSSQAFWDAFEQILPEKSSGDDSLEDAQLRLLALWKEKQAISRRLLAYDTTNFYTYIASTNTRNELAQRGHNKQGRHNLRQVGLSYVLDGESGLSLCHHVYPGDVADAEEFSAALSRITRMLDHNQIARDSVTLVFDKGTAALANTVELEEARVGWISALPWNQAPAELRERAVEQLPPCSSQQPGVRAAAEKLLVHGKEYLCVVKYSASFAGEQLHSLTTSMSKVMQYLRRFSMELNKPKARWDEKKIRSKIQRWLSAQFLTDVIRYDIQQRDGHWHLQFDFNNDAWQRCWRIVSAAPFYSPIAWTGRRNRWRRDTPASNPSRESSADSRMESGWAGDRCITGRIARFAFMLSIACLESHCCSMCTSRRKPRGTGSPWSNCSKNCSRSSSSFCSIRRRAKKGRIAFHSYLQADPGATISRSNLGLGSTV
jgi:hypothetical protein